MCIENNSGTYHISVHYGSQSVNIRVLQKLIKVLDGGHLFIQILHYILQIH